MALRRRSLLAGVAAGALLAGEVEAQPWQSVLFGGGPSVIATVNALASNLNSGNPLFTSGTIVGATTAWAVLYTSGAEEGARAAVSIASGVWFALDLLTPATAASYTVRLMSALAGGTMYAESAAFTTTAWAKPEDSWRATINSVTDSNNVTADINALAASSTNKLLTHITVAAATLGAAITAVATGNGTQTVTLTEAAHGRSTGQWIKVVSGITGVAAQAYQITVTASNTYTILAAANTGSGTIGATPTINAITPTSRTITFTLAAIAAPGGMIYSSLKTTLAATLSSANSVFVPYPTTYQNPDNVADRGAVVSVATNAGTQAVAVTMANYDTANIADWWLGAFQYRSDGNHNLWLINGPSYTHYAWQVLEARAQMIAAYPTSDPVFVNTGYPGQKYGLIDTTAITPAWASQSTTGAPIPWGFAYMDSDPNDIGSARPYSGDASPTLIATGLGTCITDLKANMPAGRPIYVANGDYFNAPDKVTGGVRTGTGNGTLTALTTYLNGVWTINFTGATAGNVVDPLGNTIGTFAALGAIDLTDTAFTLTAGGTAFVNGDKFTVTAVQAVGGTAGQAQGMKPYNDNQLVPLLRTSTGIIAIRAPLDVPQIDDYTGPMALPYAQLNAEGTHPSIMGYDNFIDVRSPIYMHAQTGRAGPSQIERLVNRATGPIPAWWQTRLAALFSALPATTDPVAPTVRTALSAKVAALSNTYADPAGTLPSGTSTAPLFWADFAKFDLMTSPTSQLAKSEQVQTFTDRIAGSVGTIGTNRAPGYIPAAYNGRGVLLTGTRSNQSVAAPSGLLCYVDFADVALTTALAGLVTASVAFSVLTVARLGVKGLFTGNAGEVMSIAGGATVQYRQGLLGGALGVNTTAFRANVSNTVVTDATGAGVCRLAAYLVTYAGGTNGSYKIFRNVGAGFGSAIASGTLTKPAWTALSNLRVGLNAASPASGQGAGWQGTIGEVAVWGYDLSAVAGDMTILGNYTTSKWALV